MNRRSLRVEIAGSALLLAGVLVAPGPASCAAEKSRRHSPSGATADSAQVLSLLRGVPNATCPVPGVASAGQPTAGHLAELRKAGFRAVLDLRPSSEPRGYDEPAAARKAGLRYQTLPIDHGGVADSTFDAFRSLMADSASRPVLVHCASGNRVGPVMMAWLVLDRGWGLERATAAAKQGGLRSAALEAAAVDYIERHRAR